MTAKIKLLLLSLTALLSVYIGAIAFDDVQAVRVFKHIGYYTIAFTFGLFVWFVIRAFPLSWSRAKSLLLRREVQVGLLVSVFGTTFMLREEPLDFKTIMDEHIIASTAKRMHEDRQIEAVTRLLTIEAVATPLRGFVDKRPVFFPFLVSIINDLAGFRPRNGIYLNAFFITPLTLFLLYLAVLRFTNVASASASVVLVASVPILSFVCAGGGLEPLNLLLIILTCFLGGLYLEKPDPFRLGAFCLSGILLAQARYESALFIGVVGLVVAWSWLREKKLLIYWPLFFCPVLLIPYLLQNRVFQVTSVFWQMDGSLPGDKPFGFEFMHENLGRALGFFFDFGHDVPNSWFLAGAGLLALLLLLVSSLKQMKHFSTFHPALQSAVIFLFGFLALFILLLAYSWRFDHPVIRRLSLPLHLPLAVSAAYLFYNYNKNIWVVRGFTLVVGLYFVVYAFPITSKRIYSHQNIAAADHRAAEAFIEEVRGSNPLFIADNAHFYNLFGMDVLSTPLANMRKEALVFFINQPLAPPVYHYESLVYDPVGARFELDTLGPGLDQDFELEPVWEKPISFKRKIRFSKVTGVNNLPYERISYDSKAEYLNEVGKNIP